MFEQFGFFQEFIIETWGTYSEFVDFINSTNEDLFFEGEATMQKVYLIGGKKFTDTFLFFKLNNRYFCSIFKEDREEHGVIYFDGISEMSEIIFKSEDYLELIRRSSKNRFKDLGVGIHITIKCYTYQDEQRIIMSQKDKIDMIYLQKMFLDESDNFSFKTEISVSLKKLVEWYKFNEATMAKLKALETKKLQDNPVSYECDKLED